jgi:hypothetical protein
MIALHLPNGPYDRDRPVSVFLGQALYCEELGTAALFRQASGESNPGVARCLLAYAQENERHVRMLRTLLGREKPYVPAAPIRLAVRWLVSDRSIDEHCVACLVGETAGLAYYEMVVDRLVEGRVAEVLRLIADEKRLHVAFTRDLLGSLLSTLPSGRVRHLLRLRSSLVLLIVVGHVMDCWRVFGRAAGVSTGKARRRVLAAIESAFGGLPGLTLPR